MWEELDIDQKFTLWFILFFVSIMVWFASGIKTEIKTHTENKYSIENGQECIIFNDNGTRYAACEDDKIVRVEDKWYYIKDLIEKEKNDNEENNTDGQ